MDLFLLSWFEKIFKWIESLLKCTGIICNGVLLKLFWIMLVLAVIIVILGLLFGSKKECKNGYSGNSCENCLYFKLII